MKTITTKPTQMRLDSYVFEKLENRACGTLKIDDLAANVAVRVENANKKRAKLGATQSYLGNIG